MSRLSAACLASCVLAACSVTPAGPCDTDAQCTAPATCDTGRHLCVLPCEPKCGIGEVCLSAKCVQQGPIVKSVSAPTTWSKRAGNVTVTASIDSGANATTQSATLHVANHTDVAGSTSDAGQTRTYSFSVPATYQAQGSDTPVAFTVDAVDNAGHATQTNAVGNGQLLIDDKAPVVNGVTINGGVTATDGLQWFAQSATGAIDAQISMQDGTGSGINTNSLHLLAGATQLDTAVTCGTATAPLVCHFSIPPGTSAIATGKQGEVQFSVTGTDVAGNNFAANQAKFGIDGQKPVINFTPTYPSAFADCNGTTGDDGTIFCGHDGSHFFRSGDGKYNLTFTLNDATGGAGDKGSGPAPTSGTCAITGTGTSCAVTFSNGNFQFAASFAGATITNPNVDGSGTVTITLNATDAVGNATDPTPVTVNVTRLKWMRTMTGKIDTFKGSPIATTKPVAQAIFAGAERDSVTNGGPIASFAPDGVVLWRTGRGDIGTISNNVAFSSTTTRLYVLGDGSTKLFVYAVGATGITGSYNCLLSDGSTTGTAAGSPAVWAGNPERALVSDSLGRLWSLTGTPSSGCAGAGNAFTNNGGAWTSSLNSPTTDGASVYVSHDNATKLAKVAFTGTAFGTVADAAATFTGIVGSASIADALYFGDIGVAHLYSYSTGLSSNWAAGAAAVGSAINAPVAVNAAYAFGSATGGNGQLHAFNKNDGSEAWHWPTGTNIGNTSAPAFGADNVIYFGSDNPKQLVPVKPTGTALADNWVEFRGSGSQKTTNPVVDTSVDSLGTEPVIDSTGILYFGTAGGKVFALITDGGGPLAPVTGQTWPRVGHDNCNSSNAGFTCQ